MWWIFGVLMVVMLTIDLGVNIPIQVSSLVVSACLGLAVAASLLFGKKRVTQVIPINP
jgi:hypothetical protein